MTQLTLHLFGPPHIAVDGTPIDTDRRKAVALLIYLAVRRQAFTREALATLLWPDTEPSRAFAYLRRALWEINNVLGSGWLEADREQVALAADADIWIDVQAFWRLLADCDPQLDGARCIPALQEAVALADAPFLQGFSLRDTVSFEEWQQFQAAALRQEWADAVASLVDLLLAEQALETAVDLTRRWLLHDPLQEGAHRRLMQLYAQQGQRVMALRQYETCRQLLVDELGVPPEPATTALYEQIKTGELSPTPVAAAPRGTAVTPPAPTHNLPAQATPFVGRQAELTEIRQMIADPQQRLVTLVGPGGSGKTRLGLQAAADAAAAYADGVWFVSLAAFNAPEQIVTATVRALQFSFAEEGGSLRQQLLDYLREKNLLLLLDNFEQLIVGGGAVVCSDILAAAPQVHLLVTSRMRLNVQGETAYAVLGLATPAVETAVAWSAAQVAEAVEAYSALTLFAQSAARALPGFAVTPDNIGAVIAICRLVEGMPLGIELAAAWVELLPPADILAEIRRSLDFLETEMADVPARQRSMRAVFNYSWELMTADERALFPRLAIFHGSFSRLAAEAVARAPLRTLMRLVNKSLVRRLPDGLFAIHELLRQYAAEKLEDSADDWMATRERHSLFYLDFLQRETARMKGPAQKAAFDAVAAHLEDVRAAWLWAVVQQEYDVARRALEGLLIQHMTRSSLEALADLLRLVLDDVGTAAAVELADGQQRTAAQRLHVALEGIQSFATSNAYADPEPAAHSKRTFALLDAYDLQDEKGLFSVLAATIYHWRIDRQRGLALLREGLDGIPAGDKWARATGLSMLGNALWAMDERSAAKAALAEGIALSRAIGDRLLLAYNLGSMTNITSDEHDFAGTIAINEECCRIYESLENWIGLGNSLSGIATIYDSMGEYERALDHYRQARQIFTRIGARQHIADAMSWESLSLRRLGKYQEAVTLRQQAQALMHEVDDANGIAWSHFELGELYRLLQDAALAHTHYETSRTLFAVHNIQRGHAFYLRARAQQLIPAEQYAQAETALQEAQAISTADYHNWHLSYIETTWGYLATAVTDFDKARAHFQEALALASRLANLGIGQVAILGFAHLAQARAEPAEAAALAAFVAAHPTTWYETKQAAKAVLDDVRSQLTAAQQEAAQALGQGWSLDQVAARLLPTAGGLAD